MTQRDANHLDGKMEPDTAGMNHVDAPLYSIAISLKRIADVIAGDEKHLNFTNAITDAIWRGLRDGR
jgi:hypothetical protein